MDSDEQKRSLENGEESVKLIQSMTSRILKLKRDNERLVALCAGHEELQKEKDEFKEKMRKIMMNPLRYIMQGYSRTVYAIGIVRDVPPVGTCGKCKDGWIYYTSPQGLHIRERCRCSVERRRYSVKEYHLARIGEQYDHLILKYSDAV